MEADLVHKGGKVMHTFTLGINTESEHLLFLMSIFGISVVHGTSVSIFS